MSPSTAPATSPAHDPIREELWSVEHLERHAAALAAEHRTRRERWGDVQLRRRMRDNGRVLLGAYRTLAESIREERAMTPATEWLVDNFHLVEDQVREIREDLPAGFYRQLPRLVGGTGRARERGESAAPGASGGSGAAGGGWRGYPRVYVVAHDFVAHTDSRFDAETLRRFVVAYQRQQVLSIGELWALTISLRLVLVENLRRLAESMVKGRAARDEADRLADALLKGELVGDGAVGAALRRHAESGLDLPFVVELVGRLRDQDPAVTPALTSIDRRLAERGTTADEVVAGEYQRQVAMNATVRNIITSMRAVSIFDWAAFFESVSAVDKTLGEHAGYRAMEFGTRDSYRRAVEELARGGRLGEVEVARRAVERAAAAGRSAAAAATRAATAPGTAAAAVGRTAVGAGPAGTAAGEGTANDGARRADPGYYLIGAGRRAFERDIGARVPRQLWLRRTFLTHATPSYLGSIAALTAAALALPLWLQQGGGGGGPVRWPLAAVLTLLALLPASELAVQLVNAWVMERLGPRVLPRLDLRQGVPPALRTLVCVPTLLTSAAEVEELLARLEVHYLANADPEIYFAILSDWGDAAEESLPGDAELLGAAVAGVSGLNSRHADGGAPRFLLLHRRRVWNRGEGRWMGWERKRGKLEELNRLLRGATDTTFLTAGGGDGAEQFGAARLPAEVRYVITLDADTRLPRGAAARLVGTLAHPLNRARFDARLGRVVEGYGILQPRVTPTLPNGREGSLYQRIFSGPAGIDPYSAAVSDVYQDLFGEGSFTGKGIYDVDAFGAALAGKVPEGRLLSHDLFEGIFARAGLVTDIELFEEFPAHFQAAQARQHRWARGDWQLLPWILGLRVGGRASRLPAIGRFKMIDNLRRTLVAPASWLLLLAAWALPGARPAAWLGFWLLAIALPNLIPVLYSAVPRRRGISVRSHTRGVAHDLALAAARIALAATFVAYQAWLMADAVGRTLVRLVVTRRRLLQWVTAAQAKIGLRLDLGAFYRRMAGGVGLAVVAAAGVTAAGLAGAGVAAAALARAGLVGTGGAAGALARAGGGAAGPLTGAAAAAGLAWVVPFLVVWLAAPAVARWLSLPLGPPRTLPLTAADRRQLRRIARRTWRYFETFVGDEDHALPPDNVQEDPARVVAHRTSPTNIGLYLLSALAARDFGWLGTVDLVGRLEQTLATLDAMEHFRGHLLNWYDTQDLRPLEPRYVSTVDSGNLAGHLLTLAEGCTRLAARPLGRPAALAGIADAIDCLRAAAPASAGQRTQMVTRRHLDEALAAVDATLAARPPAVDKGQKAAAGEGTAAEPAGWTARLAAVAAAVHGLVDVARALADEQRQGADAAAWAEAHAWAELAAAGVASHQRDAAAAAPTAAGEAAAATAGSGSAAAGTAGGAGGERDLARRLALLAGRAAAMVEAMDLGFLYDRVRKLFAIGYRVPERELDGSYYDLLASEARLASFIAIAKGTVPVEHWFQLGRQLTPVDGGAVLISWSGSMFEYLMPSLVLRAPAHSLLDQTCRLVVRRQIQYGGERGVPWGISESAFNARDLQLTYQYSNFGVPGLGLKRGLSEDLVVAPYATALAAMFDPAAAVRNFARLEAAGAAGAYGFHEAIDYTASRLPDDSERAVVRAFMAHHQGMSLVALANALDEAAGGAGLPALFHARPEVQATELLLQERTPRDVAVARPRAEEVSAAAQIGALLPPLARRYDTPHDATPRTHLLSNGRYVVMLTAAGAGYSRVGDLAVTRYREDPTRDCWGTFFFLRDTQSGAVWSAGFQPSGAEPESYEALFSEDRAEINRRDGSLASRLEVVVTPEDDGEVRRLSLTSYGLRPREIEVTSYCEVVLAPQAADIAHPAFSNLFVETEFLPAAGALLAWRRPRSTDEERVWAVHVAAVAGEPVAAVQFETDRSRFLGRGRGVRTPMSVVDGRPLSNTAGAALDPIFSLRRRVRLLPGSTVRLAFATLTAATREAALALAEKYRDPAAFERAASMAWTRAQVHLRHLGIPPDEANLFQRLANRILYSDAALRPGQEVLAKNAAGVPALWAHGISGDLPIVVARIDEMDDLALVRQLLKAHEYFRAKLLAVDLVILNQKASSYAQDLQGALEALVRTAQARHHDEEGGVPRGGLFVLRGEQLTAEARGAILAQARAVLQARHGTLAEQIVRRDRGDERPPARLRRAAAAEPAEAPPARPDIEFWNGLGGFTRDGSEYITILGEGQWTPAPWINVIANPGFGFQVSESGAGYTWSGNSRENQLTPWSNDPVSDPPGEILYVRDEESGTLWGPTLLPIREEPWLYIARHGQGYSCFEHASHGIALELLVLVPPDDPVKISRLRIKNRDGRPRRLSVTAYVEWVLGSVRAAAAPSIVTEIDGESGAFFARRGWNEELGAGRVAFADLAGKQASWTGDRTELLGRNGTYDHPAALEDLDHRLSGRVGAALDPCAALKTAVIELRPGAEVDVVFLLGECAGVARARQLVAKYRAADVAAVLAAVTRQWDDVAGALQVKTPDRSLDLLVNRWLLYQTLSCRLWARTAFYQAGGAYGFRDQLQDVMALTRARREVAREHILRAAGRQFVEGDVQHWWHPPSGRGVRTHISDDLLWLPYAALHYVEVTGENELFDEMVGFLEGPAVPAGHDDSYFVPEAAREGGTLFEHCARAIDLRLAAGAHGLPLMGSGDWNDGMNRVGREGRGESVWLGWFLHTLLWEFARIADERGEPARATAWRARRETLKTALEDSWDNDWYRRAYFDDGTPLGSAASGECRIDSIAQSWAVISGAADRGRAAQAMAAVEEYLVRRGDGLVLLFTPPFDHGALDPGYIKGYLPGVRENGGQYTHAAIWCILAYAALGDGDRAGELFSILNPINHGSTRAGIQRYKVEPYVAAGDIYAEGHHVGRGGWTWYSGSAGWMYRAGVEWILGIRLRATLLSIDPSIPRAWPGYEATFRYHSASYRLHIANPRGATRGVTSCTLDGENVAVPATGAADIPLQKEGNHTIEIVLG